MIKRGFLYCVENVISMRLEGRGGGAFRGDDFRYELYRQLGTKEIDDQIIGAQGDREKPF